MFSGIVEELGVVESLAPQRTGATLRVRCQKVLEDAIEGCSIAVNGVCLTAVDLQSDSFSANLAPETLARTNLGHLVSGGPVNLERPLAAGGRLSGHIVQGHVDGTGVLLQLQPLGGENWWLRLGVPKELDRYLVFKGSVALDGISLTVARIDAQELGIAIIPHTIEHTNLRLRKVGDHINIECDILAKYVEKLAAEWARPAP